MADDRDRDRLSFLEGPLPLRFRRQVITVAPDQSRRYDEAEWRDSIVVIERGEIELEGLSGRRCRFAGGDILCLVGVPLRALHNVGAEPAVLVAVSRVVEPGPSGRDD
jgi:hypothetical protein